MRSRYQAGRHEARVSGLHSHTREYTVRFYVAGVHQRAADYFTSDRTDAHDTARAEIARLHMVDQVTTRTLDHERRTEEHHQDCAGVITWRARVRDRIAARAGREASDFEAVF